MATTTLLAKRLFDGSGAPPIDDAFLRVEDGLIAAVGRRVELGSTAIGGRDLGDVTLLPGLVNMHTHLTCSCSPTVLADALHDSYETKMMRAVENARASLLSGVTTIRDCGTLNPIVFAIREASRQGLITAPHVWASGEVLTSTGGHCYFFGVECDSVEDVKRAVRRQVKAGADYIKVMASGGGLTPNTNPRAAQFGPAEMVAIVDDSARIGKLVAAHCHGTPSIRNALDARVRTIEHCSFMVPTPAGVEYEQPLADGIAEAGIFVCPTIGVGERNRQLLRQRGESNPFEATRERRLDSMRRLWQSGVQFVSGNDAGMVMTGFDDFQLDLELLVEHVGLSAAEAIQTATGKAAEAIDSSEFGVLAPGRRADIIAARGNALNDIGALRNLALIMKSGVVVVDTAA
jgi:imidazolonepropionase-like amidohydrolase